MQNADQQTHGREPQRGNAVKQHKMGMEITIKGFIFAAAASSPCMMWCSARNDPHPGQYSPVSAWKGHVG